MLQTQEQVVDEVKEEATEIVELSELDMEWIGGGSGDMHTGY
jgi:hypothetical protein